MDDLKDQTGRDDRAERSVEVKMALDRLSPRKAKFVLNVCAGMKPVDALLDAGCQSKRHIAITMANRMLRKDEKVKDAIAIIRSEMVKKSEYSFDKFMDELNEALVFAKETKNATALVRGIELKGKASGHIVERIDQKTQSTGFQLVVAGVAPPVQSAPEPGPREVH